RARPALPGRDPRRLRGHRGERSGPDRPRPARALAGGEARRRGPAARRDPRVLPSDRRAGGPPPGGARRLALRIGRDARGPAALVACGGPVGAARPPHGGPHGVPHRRPAARPRPGFVNLLDLLIILLAAAAAYGGYRLGFLARIFSWAGLAVGALVADRFLPDVVAFFSSSDPPIRPLAAGLRQGDRVAGSALGIVGVLTAVWVLTPALAAVSGWPAEAIRGSAVAHLVE